MQCASSHAARAEGAMSPPAHRIPIAPVREHGPHELLGLAVPPDAF